MGRAQSLRQWSDDPFPVSSPLLPGCFNGLSHGGEEGEKKGREEGGREGGKEPIKQLSNRIPSII